MERYGIIFSCYMDGVSVEHHISFVMKNAGLHIIKQMKGW